MRKVAALGWMAVVMLMTAGVAPLPDDVHVIRSKTSGRWSDAGTWEGDKIPAKGARVQIRPGHVVEYDLSSDTPLRTIHVAGRLTFATDRDTRLDVGLIRIQTGETFVEEGFDCHMVHRADHGGGHQGEAALEIGTPESPVPADHTATVTLVHFDGADPMSLPAIVACGGRLDIHGAPMRRTWVKLQQTAAVGETRLFLAEPVADWRAGDRIIITGTNRQRPFAGQSTDHVTDQPTTEERIIRSVASWKFRDFTEDRDGLVIELDRPLEHPHSADDGYAAEVANLSRNVRIESADPDGVRGHTMYHRDSSGSISYAEFRHLGKRDVLGRYPIHFHLTGDSMRGSSVVGVSIWDSHNRWITLHGARYMVVRDCVGYQSVGHGFFLEDGTEVFNVLDRNLAVQALVGKPLPDQALPYDHNDGAGFWWANSLNSFTRNVAAECDQHGFRFEVEKTAQFDPVLAIAQRDGTVKQVDIRTLPFIRFEGNEIHTQRRFGMNLGGIRGMTYSGDSTQPESIGGDVDGVGPDRHHPFIIRDLKVWDTHWPFHAGSPSVFVHSLDIFDCEYGLWRCVMDLHQYRRLSIREVKANALFFPMGGHGPDIHLEDGVPTFPSLDPVDDFAPVTIITGVRARPDGLLEVSGVATDDHRIVSVNVNGHSATATEPNFAQWTITLPRSDAARITSQAEDAAGNVEPQPHTASASAH